MGVNDRAKTAAVAETRAGRSKAKAFVLWREVMMAYLSPAVMAGIGGLLTADKGLQIGALTTIGGTSALVALLLGLWLLAKGGEDGWITRTPQLMVIVIMVLAGAAAGLSAAWTVSWLADRLGMRQQMGWIDRIWFDFPMSAAIASALITGRWRVAIVSKNRQRRR
ncbi:hypothetical protein [Brevibacillus parabrevis]|uniref:hypothetical protein n=1 Tax=Brevibacillus parabrevis TaxID=54914 RepID=UPI000AADF40B|nr:hypothetical protein [Brevibacillus parabrevis]